MVTNTWLFLPRHICFTVKEARYILTMHLNNSTELILLIIWKHPYNKNVSAETIFMFEHIIYSNYFGLIDVQF